MKTIEQKEFSLLRIYYSALRLICKNPLHFFLVFEVAITLFLCGLHFKLAHLFVFSIQAIQNPFWIQKIRQSIPYLSEATSQIERNKIIDTFYLNKWKTRNNK